MKRRNRKTNSNVKSESLEVRALLTADVMASTGLTEQTTQENAAEKATPDEEVSAELLTEAVASAGRELVQEATTSAESEGQSQPTVSTADTESNKSEHAEFELFIAESGEAVTVSLQSGRTISFDVAAGDIVLVHTESQILSVVGDSRAILIDLVSGETADVPLAERAAELPVDESTEVVTKSSDDSDKDGDRKSDEEDKEERLALNEAARQRIQRLRIFLHLALYGIHGPYGIGFAHAERRLDGKIFGEDLRPEDRVIDEPGLDRKEIAALLTQVSNPSILIGKMLIQKRLADLENALIVEETLTIGDIRSLGRAWDQQAAQVEQAKQAQQDAQSEPEMNPSEDPNAETQHVPGMNSYAFDFDFHFNPFNSEESSNDSSNQSSDGKDSGSSDASPGTTMAPPARGNNNNPQESDDSDSSSANGDETENEKEPDSAQSGGAPARAARNADGTPKSPDNRGSQESDDNSDGEDTDEDEDDSNEDDPAALRGGSLDDHDDNGSPEDVSWMEDFSSNGGGVICPLTGEERVHGGKLPDGITPEKGDIDPAPDTETDDGAPAVPTGIGGSVVEASQDGFTCPIDGDEANHDRLWVANSFIADLILNGPGGGTAPVSTP